MFINPKKAIEEGWITHPNCTSIDDWIELKYMSPNAIDFTLDQLYTIDSEIPCLIAEDRKLMRGGKQCPTHLHPNGQSFWNLDPTSVYDCLSDIYVDLPEGIAATLVIRSTFNRNGIFLTSGLYDSGFKGHIGFTLHNCSGKAVIETGVRVGQIAFIKADNSTMYEGGWNHQQGTHYNTVNVDQFEMSYDVEDLEESEQ